MHDENYSISVIVPTYNRADYLPCAIDSILRQRYSPCEIIIVDDGSTDNTEDVLATYGSKIRYIKKENGGVCSARNAGIQAARHEWIAFLDSDDEWIEGKLQYQVDDLKSHPEAIAHFTNVIIDREFVREIDIFHLRQMTSEFDNAGILYLERPLKLCIDHVFGRVQSVLARKDIVQRIGGFDAQYKIFEDADFVARLAFEGPWVVRAKPLVREIRREEATVSLGQQKFSTPYRGYDNLLKQTIEYEDLRDINTEEAESLNRAVVKYSLLSASAHLKFGDKTIARKSALTAMRRRFSVKAMIYLAASFLPFRLLTISDR